MKRLYALLIAIAACTQIGAAIKPGNGIHVENMGLDGDERIYRLQCPGGRLTTLSYRFKETRFCYLTPEGEARCVNTDDVDAAALEACNQK